ncbi:F-box/LRR-repeat protein 15-like isoform X1 [Schistocerca americana]|nr:F-box/LRR-repeat protein 15-like isoform X1 [Schistocerca americana]
MQFHFPDSSESVVNNTLLCWVDIQPLFTKEMASTPQAVICDDLLLSIFSFLPIPDLARCAAVCQQWHKIVTGFTHLWKGKRYVSDRSPRESDETRAILSTLPPLQEVIVKQHVNFEVDISYPRMVLSVTSISDLGATRGYQRLTCAYLSTKLDIADSTLSPRSPVDLAALRKLRIVRAIPTLEPDARAEYAVSSALHLCPNLRELSVYVDSMSADCLEGSEGVGRLRTLEIRCPRLKELSFLRHCSAALEELELKGCSDLPSAAYAELRHLGNLQRLRLRDCCVLGDDLEAAVTGLRSLASLQLVDCVFVSDLSFLRHCDRLRELRVEAEDAPVAGLRHLPAGVRSLCLVGDTVTAEDLSELLPRLPLLEELDLCRAELAHLGFLRHCPRLRRLCLEFSTWPDEWELSNLHHLTQLEVLDLRRCAVDADVLSGVMPSLPRLDALLLAHVEDIVHLEFLGCCPQIRKLSLFNAFGWELEAYRELCHLKNLQHLCVSKLVYNFVHELVRPCLPRVKIYCSDRSI